MARKQRSGVVVGDAMDKTVVVSIQRTVTHPLYHKVLRRRKKYQAHDETNLAKLGDRVLIEECRPISKHKRWRVLEILLDYTRGAGATMVTVTHDHDLLDHFDSVIDLRPSARGMTAVYRDVPTAADMKGDGQP